MGYNMMGSSTSRLRARTSIAAKSVPTAAKPSVPAATSKASGTPCSITGALNKRPISGTRTSSTSPISSRMPRSLPT